MTGLVISVSRAGRKLLSRVSLESVRFSVALVAGWLVACGSSAPEQPLLSAENLATARTLVRTSEATGQLARWSCVGNEAFVNPLTWAAFDVDEKRGMAISLAAICEAENSGRYINIFDHQSGQKLANFDGLRFTVE